MSGILKNINKPAPKWFIKIKKASTFLSDAAVLILLGIGYSESSLIMLLLRVGVSAVLNTLETFLIEEE